jgi:hypothetical protein
MRRADDAAAPLESYPVVQKQMLEKKSPFI